MRCPLEDDYGSNAVEGLKKKTKKETHEHYKGLLRMVKEQMKYNNVHMKTVTWTSYTF